MSTLTSAPVMDTKEKLFRGEKLVVTAFMPALVAEGFLLPLALIMQFSWIGLIYAALTAGLLVWCTGRLYNGEKDARIVAEALALLQVVVSFVCTILLAYTPAADRITHLVAQPVLWMALTKLSAYGLLGLILLLCRDVLDFMAIRRGEEVAVAEPVTASGVVVTFSDPQKERFAKLASSLSKTGTVLLIAGALLLVYAFSPLVLPPRPTKGLQEALPRLAPWLGQSLLPGVVAILTGVILLVTAPWAKRVQTEGTDKAYVAGLLGALTSLFRWQLLLTVLGTVAALASLYVLIA